MENPILKEAKAALEELSADREVRERAARRYEELMLQRYGEELAREQARAEGLAEGRAEGQAEGRAEGQAEGRAEGAVAAKRDTLRRLLTLKFGSVSAEAEARIVQGSEAQLDGWLDRVLMAETERAVF